jgi:hypothetical protein
MKLRGALLITLIFAINLMMACQAWAALCFNYVKCDETACCDCLSNPDKCSPAVSRAESIQTAAPAILDAPSSITPIILIRAEQVFAYESFPSLTAQYRVCHPPTGPPQA